ncbi:MAG: capsule assembly Wzi family protein [Algoriphagus sp.]
MIPNPGFQTYFSGGVEVKYKFINLTLRPELALAQNKGFETKLDQFTNTEISSKYVYWNRGDFPERFGAGWVVNPWWGQSKLSFQYGAFEIGAATENIWWGPGQFNALTFSNNAPGFPHLTLNTTKPAKTLIGNFETQLIIGKLNNSDYDPSQYPELNSEYFRPFSGDWRYLNALMLSYNPKWIPGLFVGFTRTFQQYRESMGTGFLAYFPVFEGITKVNYGFDNDSNGQDQQISVFGRYVIPKSKTELYFEFGRRDHALNWREFTLNPEHARAYILGFIQLFDLPTASKMIQVRGEMTQQQESINRYIRYQGLGGGSTWHTHGLARGFTNYGQPLGVGIGVGSNVQTLEFSLVEGVDKMGIQLERLANNQDFYYKAQLQDTERKPWVDLSLGFLYDKKFDRLLLSSKLQIIHARNYQWQLAPESTPDFPKGENLTSFLAQTSLIYFWNK